jgi:phosphate transport system ATP-binding protein
MTTSMLATQGLCAAYGSHRVLADVTLAFEPHAVTALMGPSGCGKTTLLRCFNRIHETIVGARVDGSVLLDGENIYGRGVNPIGLRRRIGMVFQRPNPFPTFSIFDNVACGLPREVPKSQRAAIVEKSLRAATLWEDVKDRLPKPATVLSGGQQQRLCIARAIAVEPEILLMDEPTSSLDPISTSSIEDLMTTLSESYTIVIVTHNMQQAARVSDFAAFFLGDENGVGRLVEFSETNKMFTKPSDRRTEDYITGRFG